MPVSIVLPDGTEKAGVKGVTTPLDVANGLSKSLAKKAVVSKVDGKAWDLFRPLEGDCALQILTFDDPDGKDVRPARPLGLWPAHNVLLCVVVHQRTGSACLTVLASAF